MLLFKNTIFGQINLKVQVHDDRKIFEHSFASFTLGIISEVTAAAYKVIVKDPRMSESKCEEYWHVDSRHDGDG